MTINLLIVEDNKKLRTALTTGLEDTGRITVLNDCESGEDALAYCLTNTPEAILMDVQLAGETNGIQTVAGIRETVLLPEAMRLRRVFGVMLKVVVLMGSIKWAGIYMSGVRI